MKLGWKGWVAIAAGTWLLLRATKPAFFQQWYQDLMLRAFASDYTVEPGKTPEEQKRFEEAADLAAKYLLPMGWVLHCAEIATGVTLEQAVQKVQAKVMAMGPPTDAKPETLAQYKQEALDAAGEVA